MKQISESLAIAKRLPPNYYVNHTMNYSDLDPILTFPPIFNETTQELMLINFDPNTDPTGTRKVLMNIGCSNSKTRSKPIVDRKSGDSNDWADFTVCKTKDSGVRQYLPVMSSIYKANMEQIFWLSPRGNGIDCHRTWEALYLGRIPIVESSEIDILFQDLPVFIVKDWKEITLEKLLEVFIDFTEKRQQNKYNFKKLHPSYWNAMITSLNNYTNDRPERCWGPNE
jgi:hypothetical protein